MRYKEEGEERKQSREKDTMVGIEIGSNGSLFLTINKKARSSSPLSSSLLSFCHRRLLPSFFSSFFSFFFSHSIFLLLFIPNSFPSFLFLCPYPPPPSSPPSFETKDGSNANSKTSNLFTHPRTSTSILPSPTPQRMIVTLSSGTFIFRSVMLRRKEKVRERKRTIFRRKEKVRERKRIFIVIIIYTE